MQAFRFRLERVLAWRGQELARDEAALERLRTALRDTQADAQRLPMRLAEARLLLAASGSIRGSDVASLESHRLWAKRETARLSARAADLAKAIEGQERATALARTRVKALERLKERFRANWTAEFDRELELLAGEFSVGQWRRAHAGRWPRN